MTKMLEKETGKLSPEKMSPSSDSPHILVGKLGATDQLYWDAILMLGLGRMDELRSYVSEVRGHVNESSYSLGLGMARFDGDKSAFDDLAVEFAVNIGVNPPAWIDQHSKAIKTEIEINRIEVVSLNHDKIVDTTIKMESPWPIRLDLAKVESFNSMGLDLFNESMSSRLDRNLRTSVAGGDGLVDRLYEYAKGNSFQIAKSSWGFIFCYLKLTNQKDRFGQIMKSFIESGGEEIVFEDRSEKISDKPEVKSQTKGAALGDKLSGLGQDFARRIKAIQGFERHLNGGDPIVIDFSSTRVASIVDISSVSAFFSEFSSQRVQFHFVNVNEIVIGILRAIGVNSELVKISAAAVEV